MHADAIATTGGEPQVSPTFLAVAAVVHAGVQANWPESWAFEIAMQMILSGASVGVAIAAFDRTARWVQ